MTTRWNPGQYLKFTDHRSRPALDLINQINIDQPETVYDLGCGPGNITQLLHQRWPQASLTGIDSSCEMLAKATQVSSSIDWQEGDIATWSAARPADVIFTNAALHWLDNHAALFLRLFSMINPGGVLAVQMPRNHAAKSHTLMVDTASDGPWKELLGPVLRTSPVAAPQIYYDLLVNEAAAVDIWESEYTHILEGDNAVLEWVRGTALKSLLDTFDTAHRQDWKDAFVAKYAARLNEAYPKRMDGRTLFAFRRLFIVASK
jgi:trans-aconitate 2-methyltransferase